MIILKSKREIEYIRDAGRITANALALMKKLAKPGITTGELDQRCEDYIRSCGAFPSCKGYYGFPATICASVNEEVVHGIPGHRKLKDGDIISIDLVVNKNGYHGDSTVTIPVGHVHPATLKLLKVTEESLYKGIEQAVAGNHLGDIGHAIQQFAEKHNLAVVREFCGHGIGAKFHEDPQVVHYGQAGTGIELKANMIFTIEPMINAGKAAIRELADGWTIVTKDHSLSAQWEHTILVTETGYEVLTLSNGTHLAPG